MNEGEVVLTPVPQADGKIKNRPAIILRVMPPFDDMLVCGVSRQLHQKAPVLDEIISKEDADFVSSGLRETSLIRLGFLAVLPQSEFIGVIGSIQHHGTIVCSVVWPAIWRNLQQKALRTNRM